ncbi:hypothetical protein Scep_013744 [Stephania cephalantha]|uniref:NAC domain-containing protein n=1 Tax=Stephania cephalantha TaxID=152367 RepID=A0AAP0NZP7_9MAGN
MDHNQEEYCMELPPGFRFHPTDEEIITQYLTQKVLNSSFSARAIGEVDLNKSEPWELPKKAKMGEKEYYFFCQRDRKYPTGMRTNRATESGYWKATGKDKEIFKAKNCLVGMKKTLVFYKGRAPKGEKTNWVMHEYRLEGKFSYNHLPRTAKDEWVVSRVFHKSTGVKKGPILDLPRMSSFGDGLFDYYSSLPPLMDPPYNFNTTTTIKPNSIDGDEDDGDDFSYGTVTAAQMAPARTSDANPHHQFIPYNNSTTMATNSFINSSSQYNSTTPLQIPPPNMSSSSHLFSYQGSHQNNLINHPSIPNSSTFDDPDEQAILKALAMTNNNDISYGLMKKHCKVEPYNNNQPMVSLSQDTGVSTDANTEISSVASKHDLDHHQGPSPSGSLDYLWSNY